MRVTADYPPIWLAGFAGLGWLTGQVLPHGPAWQLPAGWAVVAAGLVLMGVAALTMRRHRTTLDPFGQPRNLVTSGVFALSRNPIYLGDALILAGLCLIFRAPFAALLLVPGFVAVIGTRFIAREERLLARDFPKEFAAYRLRTRRWI
ncbi:methyltransferase family protein [Paracoccus marinaquae]|uniref:Isoprenylcysteine carboxylmethyltransferase family protein n=1 Tax=Paracoccus marinaquae TaxID=2841926 RepID=A0ABS6AKN2_9RHOB|nr:isoprenylcysteine carboxylmethyltransferase family protein [Paracoccus marinaquae]MBU3029976.1 isoprenylcysteine carboxylmethyltransferase family protein [Paracoccus marinaquae]